MKKINYLLLIMLLFFALGCRSDYMNEIDSGKSLGSFSYKQIDKEKIPQIMNFLSAKTENFKIPIKTTSALNKTETVFGEINTDYIIETINEDNETYYVFSVVPNESTDSKVYNLEVKSDNSTSESAKVVIYQPTEVWILNGNGNYSVFSGKADTYSLDGDLESSVQYLNGVGNCNPDPCPDCPGTGGSGGGGSGGPLNPGSGNPPTGGGMPTQCVGCNPGGNPGTNNPPANPNSPPSSPPPGESSGGGRWVFYCEDDGNGLKCYWFWAKYANRLINPCGGGGVVIASPQDTPCEKTKKMVQKPEVKSKVNDLYAQSKVGGEKAFMVKTDGMPSAMIEGDEHSVTLNNMNGHQGVYHNHTPDGIKMVSGKDIHRLFEFIVKQPTGTPTNSAFVGMVGSQPCAAGNCPPDGYEYFNYIIRFSGTGQQAGNFYATTYDFKVLRENYQDFERELRNKSGYSSANGNFLNFKGLEEIFFYALKKMGIDKNQMTLQKIDKNGNVTNVALDNNGKPQDVPCP